MIIKLLLDVVYSVFYVLTLPINIPNLPSEINSFISSALEYIGTGLGILSNFTHLSYLLTLFSFVIAVDVGIWVYKLIMYLVKKIPMLNIR